jgi:hypothetical protein
MDPASPPLDSVAALDQLRGMKYVWKWFALLALCFSLNSCGLVGSVFRSVGRAVNGLDGLLAPR